MNQFVLIILGIVFWIVGFVSIFSIQSEQNAEKSLFDMLCASIRLRISGKNKLENVFSFFQIGGAFWIVCGIAFSLIESQINMDSISSLIILIYALPILIGIGMIGSNQ